MTLRADHGTINTPAFSVLLSSEQNRAHDMAREDAARQRKALYAATPYVFDGLAASATGVGLQVQLATGNGMDGNGYPVFIPSSIPNTTTPAEGTAPTVTLGAAHATLARIDLVYLRAASLLTDYTPLLVSLDGGVTVTTQTVPQTKMTYFTLGVVPGTASATPVAPSPLLATDLPIAAVTVPALATTLVGGNVADVRPLFSGVATVSGITALIPKNGTSTEAYETTNGRWTGNASTDGTTTTTFGSFGQLATIANGATTITITRDACGNLTNMTEA